MPYGPKKGHSDHIAPARARDLAEAAVYAEEIGHPLNTCIDINWTRTSVGDDPKGAHLQRVIKKARRWLGKEGEELFALWVREAPRKGPNSHLMMHLPHGQLKALKKVGPDLLPEGCQDTDGKAVWIHPTGNSKEARAARVIYISKGVRPGRTADQLGIGPEKQGRVFGKRCGMTENLSAAARDRHRAATAASVAPRKGASTRAA